MNIESFAFAAQLFALCVPMFMDGDGNAVIGNVKHSGLNSAVRSKVKESDAWHLTYITELCVCVRARKGSSFAG